MTTKRIAIRDAAVAAIEAAAIVPAGSVYVNRAVGLAGRPIPALGVFTAVERVDPHNEAPKQHRRVLDLVVVVMCDGSSGDEVDDQVDILSGQVEDALHADHTVGGEANDIDLVDVAITPTADGDRVYMAAVLTFEVEYYTEVTIEATDDLATVHNEWEPRYGPPATDTIILPTT